MSTPTKPALRTPTSIQNDVVSSSSLSRSQSQQFVFMALNMTWQLAVAVLVPVLAGVALGKAFGAATVWVIAGVVVALISSGLVMWRTLRTANRLPVPKLSEAQKHEIQKQYEKDDNE